MSNVIRVSLLLALLLGGAASRPPKPRPIRWVAPQALADSLRLRPRPVLVFVHCKTHRLK